MSPIPHRRAVLAPLLLALVVAACGAGAWFARTEVRTQREAADLAAVETDGLRAARLRIEISDAAFRGMWAELAALSGIQASGETTPDELRSLGDDLQAMLDEGRLDGPSEPIVVELLDAVGRATATDGDLWALEETAYVATTPASFGGPETEPELLLLGAVLATSPSLVAIDALSLTLADELDGLGPEAADFVDATAAIVNDEPGWLGPEGATPFVGGYLPGDLLSERDPELLASLADVEALGAVWIYDQWLINRLTTGDAPPSSPSELVVSASRAQDLMVDQLLARVDDAIADASVDEPSGVLELGWMVLASIAALGAVTLGWLLLARTRRLTDVALTDPLTATGNRRRLDQIEREWANGGSPAHAAVAVLDLDRFKLVNDSFGHAAGDLVLRHVGRELVSLAGTRPASERADAIRLGGDEFAFIVTSTTPLVEDAVRQQIESIGGPVAIDGGEVVDVSLSVGVVCAAAPADLADLLATADLRAYEQKGPRGAAAPIADGIRA